MKARQALVRVAVWMVAGLATQAHCVSGGAPVLSVPADQVIAAGHPVQYAYTIMAPVSGVHVYHLGGKLVADNLQGVSPSIRFAQGEAAVGSISLGAVVVTASAEAGAAELRVQSDGEAGGGVNAIANGDTVVIAGKHYIVQSVDDNGSEAVLALDSALQVAVAAGALVAEQQEFTATVAAVGQLVNAGQPASLSMNVTATAGEAGQLASDNTFTSVVDVDFARYVRNVSSPNGGSAGTRINGEEFFAEAGQVSAVSGDVLEYALVVQAGSAAFEGAMLTDAVPAYTLYEPNSTFMNGAPLADIDGQSPLATGLPLATTGAAAGVLAKGEAVTVTFRVKVE